MKLCLHIERALFASGVPVAHTISPQCGRHTVYHRVLLDELVSGPNAWASARSALIEVREHKFIVLCGIAPECYTRLCASKVLWKICESLGVLPCREMNREGLLPMYIIILDVFGPEIGLAMKVTLHPSTYTPAMSELVWIAFNESACGCGTRRDMHCLQSRYN